MTRKVIDDTTSQDDDASFRLAPAADGQPTDGGSSDPQPDDQDTTPEEAGYGYGV